MRFLALFLSIALCLPNPALALRPRQGGLEEPDAVTKALESSLRPTTSSVLPARIQKSAGLEEPIHLRLGPAEKANFQQLREIISRTTGQDPVSNPDALLTLLGNSDHLVLVNREDLSIEIWRSSGVLEVTAFFAQADSWDEEQLVRLIGQGQLQEEDPTNQLFKMATKSVQKTKIQVDNLSDLAGALKTNQITIRAVVEPDNGLHIMSALQKNGNLADHLPAFLAIIAALTKSRETSQPAGLEEDFPVMDPEAKILTARQTLVRPTTEGFVVGGSNSTELIQELKSLNGIPFRDFQAWTREYYNPEEPYDPKNPYDIESGLHGHYPIPRREMNDDHTLVLTIPQQIIRAVSFLKSHGLTPQKVASSLFQITNLVIHHSSPEKGYAPTLPKQVRFRFEEGGHRYVIPYIDYKGWDALCAFGDKDLIKMVSLTTLVDHIESELTFRLIDIETGWSATVVSAIPYLLTRYGFGTVSPDLEEIVNTLFFTDRNDPILKARAGENAVISTPQQIERLQNILFHAPADFWDSLLPHLQFQIEDNKSNFVSLLRQAGDRADEISAKLLPSSSQPAGLEEPMSRRQFLGTGAAAVGAVAALAIPSVASSDSGKRSVTPEEALADLRQEAINHWKEIGSTPAYQGIRKPLELILYDIQTFQTLPFLAQAGVPFVVLVRSDAEEKGIRDLLKGFDMKVWQYQIIRVDPYRFNNENVREEILQGIARQISEQGYSPYRVNPTPTWLQDLLTQLQTEGILPLGDLTPALQATDRYFQQLA